MVDMEGEEFGGSKVTLALPSSAQNW